MRYLRTDKHCIRISHIKNEDRMKELRIKPVQNKTDECRQGIGQDFPVL